MEDGGGTLTGIVEKEALFNVLEKDGEQVGERRESRTEEDKFDLKGCIGIARYDRKCH